MEVEGLPVFRSHHRCVRRRPLTIPGSQQQGPEAMSGTGATLFTDSSVRVRRYSVIVGKVSVDANVAENDGSPVFIGDSSLGSAPGALILFRRPRRDGQDGTMGNGHTARRDWWALSSFFCEKGGGALSPIAQTGRCCVWLWWAGVVVSCCVVVGMCEEPIPVWDVASIANLGLVWGSPSHPDHQMACALRSLRPMPGRITAQCPQWTWHLPMPAPFNVTSFRFPSALPDSCQQRLQWVGVLIQEGRRDGYSTLLASLATFIPGVFLRVPFVFSPSPPTRPLDLEP